MIPEWFLWRIGEATSAGNPEGIPEKAAKELQGACPEKLQEKYLNKFLKSQELRGITEKSFIRGRNVWAKKNYPDEMPDK